MLVSRRTAKSAEDVVTLDNVGKLSSLDPLPSKSESLSEREILQEDAFKRMIALERKRTERSAKPFLLMLLETGDCQSDEKNGKILASVIAALVAATRETDVIGWYKNQASVG